MQAIRTAVKKLDEGGSIEDARAVCGPEVVTQVFRWKVNASITCFFIFWYSFCFANNFGW